MKKCCKCKKYKNHSKFSLNRLKKDGLQNSCKLCAKKYPRTITSVRHHEKNLLKLYGITTEQYNRFMILQQNRCKICKMPETVIKHGETCFLSVDHDHKTGRVRGLLCSKCNTGLGFFGDDVLNLQNAAQYIQDAENSTLLI